MEYLATIDSCHIKTAGSKSPATLCEHLDTSLRKYILIVSARNNKNANSRLKEIFPLFFYASDFQYSAWKTIKYLSETRCSAP